MVKQEKKNEDQVRCRNETCKLHIIVVCFDNIFPSKSMFTGDSAMEHADIDVDDPDFWKKVLPDLVKYCVPAMMTLR